MAEPLRAELQQLARDKGDWQWGDLAHNPGSMLSSARRTASAGGYDFLSPCLESAPVQLGPALLPADTPVWLSPWVLHRMPHLEDAERWLPARWTGAAIAANPYGSRHYWPLGRGALAPAGDRLRSSS